MKELNKEEMLKIDGGANFSASMMNAIYKTIEVIFSVGEALGSYIRRKIEGKMCDI
ncbi:MAG: hypothetical protein ACI310_01700 [Bacilli bacterium]